MARLLKLNCRFGNQIARFGDQMTIFGNQMKIFREQIELSQDIKLPIIMHNRNSTSDLLFIIESTNLESSSLIPPPRLPI